MSDKGDIDGAGAPPMDGARPVKGAADDEGFWVRDGVYYAAVIMNGQAHAVALHGVSRDEHATLMVEQLRKQFPSNSLRSAAEAG